MKEVSYFEFAEIICKDYNIDAYYKRFIYPNGLSKSNKITISAPYHSVIVHKDGSEYPYMLNHYTRNDEMLHHKEFKVVYITEVKSLDMIINQTGVNIDWNPAIICNGNGWRSRGYRMSYKGFYYEQ